MKLFYVLLVSIVIGCSSYKTILVNTLNEGDKVVYKNTTCISPCKIKVEYTDSISCLYTVNISAIDRKTEFIKYAQLTACKDTSILIK